jgi:alpha-ketoglutarate-dependent taurine dioxygenase
MLELPEGRDEVSAVGKRRSNMRDHLPFTLEDAEPKGLEWLSGHARRIMQSVDRFGAVLIRGFSSWRQEDLGAAVEIVSAERPLDYVYRSTPRTELARGVYTATEYPSGMTIPLHNENAYQRDWPLLLFFYCQQPAEVGGQTTLADTLAVTGRLNQQTREKFAAKGIMYVRNYREDIDLPWTAVFQTTSRREVEEYCSANDISFEWLDGNTLRTRQVCAAEQRHPVTGDPVWFNQVHLFHPSALERKTREAMRRMFREEDLPRNAMYGDGSALEEAELMAIRNAFENESVGVNWRKGDLLVLDNMRVSHGRAPYRGARKVLVAMARPFSTVSRR